MKEIELNQDMLDEINNEIALHLEKICSILGEERIIEDTDWDIVYDLSYDTKKALTGLGYIVIED